MDQTLQGRATAQRPPPFRESDLQVALLLAGLVLVLIPPLLTGFLAWRYAVDVPIIDQWSMTEDLLAFQEGEWGIADLVRSHNGHRISMSRLILVPLAIVTGWNTRIEVMLNLLTAGVVLLVLMVGLGPLSSGRSWSHPRFLMTAAAASLAVFSLAQWENWLWGVQLQVFLAVLCSVAALLALSASRLRWSFWCLAMLLAFLASFSQGPGLVTWPAGLMLLATRPAPARRKAAMMAAWVVLASAVLWFYVQDLPGDAGAGTVSRFFLENPVKFLAFVFTVLGAAVVSFTGSAWPPETSVAAPVAGAALILASGATAWHLWRSRATSVGGLLFPLGLLLLALGVAGQVGLGRAEYGLPAAMASRYVTLVAPAWAATVGLGIRAAWGDSGCGPLARMIYGSWALAAYLGLLASSVASIPYFPARHALLAPARRALAEGGPEELLARLHPEVQQVLRGLPVLRDHRLSVFRRADGGAPPPGTDVLESFEQSLVLRDAPETVVPSSRLTLSVEVTNLGGEIWPAMHQSAQPVNLSYHWIPKDGGETILDGRRTALPSPLGPGETVVLEADVEAPRVEGAYVLRLSMVQEHVDWFDTRGGSPLDLPVNVREGALTAPPGFR